MERDSQEIRLCALVLSVVAFFLFIAAEIVHEQRSAPSRGVLLLVAIGALAFAWIGPLTLLAGALRSKKFQWWQPFQGGVEFVWMQAFGWCFQSFILTCSVVVLVNPHVMKWFEGQYLLLGAIGFMAQLLLNLSIGCFREPCAVVVNNGFNDSTGGTIDALAFQFPLTTKAVVSLLVSASGTLLFICYDVFSLRGGQSPVMVALGGLEFVASALVIHVLYGCSDIPGFRFWQPFEGERTFLLLQYLGWQLFAFTIGGALSILCRSSSNSSSSGDDSVSASRGSGTAIGAMGMTSQLLLLASLQYFDSRSILQRSDSVDDDSSSTSTRIRTTKRFNCRQWRYPAEIYVASLLCIGALLVACLSYVCSSYGALLSPSLLQFCMLHNKVGWIIALASLAIAAPIANMGGVRAKPTYRWWQPFAGGTKFVFLQTLAWLWYGFYVALAIVLCMNSTSFGDLAAYVVLLVGIGSAGAIALSLAYFEPTAASDAASCTVQHPPAVTTRTTPAATAAAPARLTHWCDAIKGEVVMVLLLVGTSTLLHVGVDYCHALLQPRIRTGCLVLALALSLLAAAIAHCSGQKLYTNYRLWQPFEGGDRFVLRQAVGWALFAVQLLFDSLQLTLVPQTVPRGVLSLLGIFAIVPQLLILSSMQYFERHDAFVSTTPSERECASVEAQIRDWSALLQRASLRWHTWSSVLVVLGSACLFVSAELLGAAAVAGDTTTTTTSFQHAEEMLYLFGCMLATFGIAFIHGVLGPKVHATYRVFQPFCGGIQFITLHGVAWTLIAVAWALSTTVMYWSALFFEVAGIHVLTGVLYVAAQLLLLYSVPLFIASDDASHCRMHADTDDDALHATRTDRDCSSSSSNVDAHAVDEALTNQFFVGRLLGFSACTVFVLVDLAIVRWGPAIPVFPMSVAAVVALFSSIPLSYKFATTYYRDSQRAKNLRGSIVFVVLGCALWSFTLLLGGLLSYTLWRTQNISLSVVSSVASGGAPPTKYLGSFTGSVGFTAQLLFVQATEPLGLSKRTRMCGRVAFVRDEKVLALAATLKRHATSASIWVYSAVPLVAGLLYAHTKSVLVLPMHLATNQILVLSLCSIAVIGSAWWIQQQIVATSGSFGVAVTSPLSSTIAPPRVQATATSLSQQQQRASVLDLDVDCFVHLAAFLSVTELLLFASTSRTLHNVHSERFWQQLFTDRFAQHTTAVVARTAGLSTSMHLKAASTNHMTIRVGTHAFASTVLNRVESCVVNAICRLQVRWPLGSLSTSPSSSVSAALTTKPSTRITVVCNETDAVPQSLLHFEQRERCRKRTPSTWVALCHCVNRVTLQREAAHRACLETKLLRQTRASQLSATRSNLVNALTPLGPPPPLPTSLDAPLATCAVCAISVVHGSRLPLTLYELLCVTNDDFWATNRTDDFGGGFFVLVPASASIFIFALHRVGWGSCAMYSWVLTVVALCFVINSPRFDRVLVQLGPRPATPSFVAYQRAYHALALSSLLHLSWCCPSMNQLEASRHAPTVAQQLVRLAFRCNSVCFVALAAAAMLAFWRTQYSISTVDAATATTTERATAERGGHVVDGNLNDEVRDRIHPTTPRTRLRHMGDRDHTAANVADADNDASCVLCLLKLCDDDMGD